MKKFIAIFAISCASLLISGCFGGGEDEVSIDSSYNVQSFVGVISVATNASVNATHIMDTDAGETVYLRSVLFDLNDFEGGKLRVTGTMEETEAGDKILLVESKDVLELDTLTSEPFLFKFKDKGFEIEAPEDKFEISESESLVNFVNENYSFTVRSIPKGLELDLELYLEENYDDQIPQAVLSTLGDSYSKLNIGVGRSVYINNTSAVIYEIIFNSDGSNQAEMNVEIASILDNIYFNPEDVTQDKTNVVDDIVDPVDPTTEEENDDDNTDSSIQTSEPVDLSSLSSEVSTVVENINTQKSNLVGSKNDIYMYAITDNSYVYVSYKNDDSEEFRKLFNIDGSSFEEVASFKEGTETDWELTSGANLAFDRPLKMVFVEDDSYRQIDVKEGYRYFESRPMSLGFHYPRQWYYAGGSNSYNFSNDPLPEGETLVSIDIVDESFSSLKGEVVATNIRKVTNGSEIKYFIKVEGDEVVKVSGDSEYAEQLNIMAQTLVEIDK